MMLELIIFFFKNVDIVFWETSFSLYDVIYDEVGGTVFFLLLFFVVFPQSSSLS